MKFLEDTALHLISRLIGKCHRQYMPVRISVCAAEKYPYICPCETVGLT